MQILCIFFLCEEAKKILNSLQRKRRKAKENFTYKNHWKVSKSCNPQLELWMQWNWVSYLVLFVSKVFFYYLIFWEKVNFCVKCSEMVIFEPKCHKNGDFKVTFFFAFFASFSLRRIFFAQNAKKIFFAKNLQCIFLVLKRALFYIAKSLGEMKFTSMHHCT